MQGAEARITGATEPPEYPEEKQHPHRDAGADMKGKPAVLVDQVNAEKTEYIGGDNGTE